MKFLEVSGPGCGQACDFEDTGGRVIAFLGGSTGSFGNLMGREEIRPMLRYREK
jgi:tyrosyl-tRNA synthetase